ncbi:hypothetical protein C8F01DRAFT_1084062 [Mycena amicta]|nr:hypothetical protein C8F01DRAFT_1084062 [Mycena amicta]
MYQFMLEDTNSLQGCCGFIRLAIHVLTILPNSAGPEHIFSNFSHIHMKHRNRLNINKVHKTAVLRQDCNRTFVAAGLLPKHKLHQYSIAPDGEAQEEEEEATEPTPTPVEGEPENEESPTDDEEMPDAANDAGNGDLGEGNTFDSAAEVLVSLASNENSEGDVDNNNDLPETITSTSAAASASACSAPSLPSQSNMSSRALLKYTKIKLAELFDYPEHGMADEDLKFFWQARHATLDVEDTELEAEQTRMRASEPTVA